MKHTPQSIHSFLKYNIGSKLFEKQISIGMQINCVYFLSKFFSCLFILGVCKISHLKSSIYAFSCSLGGGKRGLIKEARNARTPSPRQLPHDSNHQQSWIRGQVPSIYLINESILFYFETNLNLLKIKKQHVYKLNGQFVSTSNSNRFC